jgi:hypothetical protein
MSRLDRQGDKPPAISKLSITCRDYVVYGFYRMYFNQWNRICMMSRLRGIGIDGRTASERKVEDDSKKLFKDERHYPIIWFLNKRGRKYDRKNQYDA